MKILYLHGWTSVVNGRKPRFLISKGHEVIQPSIPDEDFPAAVTIAEKLHRQHRPDVIVGSSRGGAVAMNMNLEDKLTPLVLLCPAWRRWGTATKVKRGTVVLHSPTDDVIPFVESIRLFKNSQFKETRLVVSGNDHRLADPKTLAAMNEACLNHRPRVMGVDFGASQTAGEQAKKTIAIEAVKLSDRVYSIENGGRNARLRISAPTGRMRATPRPKDWKQNRAGWTIPDLCDSLESDPSVVVGAFDFPFSIPHSLLNDPAFAAACRSTNAPSPLKTRRRWIDFVARHLTLKFDGDRATSKMVGLDSFDGIRNSAFWKPRATDTATGGSPPLKHQYQSLFNMTLCGAAMLSRLRKSGYSENLRNTTPQVQSIFETYPRETARRVGFRGSYKSDPQTCLQQAVRYLKERGIELKFDRAVKEFCLNYRTGNNDPDAADAFLCLIAAICFDCGRADLCHGNASKKVLSQEGAIIVPQPLD